MEDGQRRLEQKLRIELIQDGSPRAFLAAYNQFHQHVNSHGMWGKPTFGHLYRSRIDLIDTLLLRLIPPHSSVLELGIGDGVFASACASQKSNVVGIDISDIALRVARGLHADGAQFHVLQGDARFLSFLDESFQYVISRDLIEHLPEIDVAAHLREVKRVLQPDGIYLLWTPPPWLGHSLGLHLKEYTAKQVLHELDKEGFEAKIIPLQLRMLGLAHSLARDSLALKAFLRLETVTVRLGMSKLTEKLPVRFRWALLPSACVVATKRSSSCPALPVARIMRGSS